MKASMKMLASRSRKRNTGENEKIKNERFIYLVFIILLALGNIYSGEKTFLKSSSFFSFVFRKKTIFRFHKTIYLIKTY